jgi:DNA-binding transcriptional MerR regulator
MYVEKDIALLEKIKNLLKIQKYTIKGAKEILEAENQVFDSPSLPLNPHPATKITPNARELLIKLKLFLTEIKENL